MGRSRLAQGTLMDAGTMFVSMMVGTVGFALLMYGKKQTRIPHLAVGLVMIIYPWFITTVWLSLAVAIALLGTLFAATRAGV